MNIKKIIILDKFKKIFIAISIILMVLITFYAYFMDSRCNTISSYFYIKKEQIFLLNIFYFLVFLVLLIVKVRLNYKFIFSIITSISFLFLLFFAIPSPLDFDRYKDDPTRGPFCKDSCDHTPAPGQLITEECSGDVGKPAIYIYPKETTNISVKLKIKGKLKKVIPEYNNGWNVRVKPNGQMKVIGGNSQITYDYLFYENTVDRVIQPEEGWVVAKSDLEKWFNIYLYKMGLNKNESDEFIDYWVPRLNNEVKEDFIIIKLFSDDFLKEYMELTIKPTPEKILRTEFIFKGIDKNINIKEPKIKEFKREGYFVVEWGGAII